MSSLRYRWWIIIAIGLFAIGIVFGLTAPAGIVSLLSDELAALEELGEVLAPFTLSMFIFIFIKNAVTLLVSFALSPIFCLVPILALIINGWVIAFVSTLVIEEESIGFLLAGLLPHGIFELPALVLGQAAALSFGAVVIISLFKEEGKTLILSSLKQNLRYLTIALILLLPAAVIETYITPLLLG